jgi:hypothetical protein
MPNNVREGARLAQTPMPIPFIIHPILEFEETVELFHDLIGCSGWHYLDDFKFAGLRILKLVMVGRNTVHRNVR